MECKYDKKIRTNFLRRYGVTIDYRRMKVKFTLEDGKMFSLDEGTNIV